LQVTVVEPTANDAPDVCEQLVVRGALPPAGTGAANVTGAVAAPVAARADALAGHVMVSVGVGVTGVLPEQPDQTITPVPTIANLTKVTRRVPFTN
jgi:hypothetical protein